MRKSIGSMAAILCALGMVDGCAAAENSSSLTSGSMGKINLSPFFYYIPTQDVPVIMAQAVETATQPDYLLKTCDEMSSGGGTIDPAAVLVFQVVQQHGQKISYDEAYARMATVKLTQVKDYGHVALIPRTGAAGRVFFEYRVEPGYVGKDQAIFMAEFEGKRYKIVSNLVVSKGIDDNNPQCGQPQLIKINGKPVSGSVGYGFNVGVLDSFTVDASNINVTLNIADLAGAAVGQTFGSSQNLGSGLAM